MLKHFEKTCRFQIDAERWFADVASGLTQMKQFIVALIERQNKLFWFVQMFLLLRAEQNRLRVNKQELIVKYLKQYPPLGQS